MSNLPQKLEPTGYRPEPKAPRVRPVPPPGRTGATVQWTADEQESLNQAFARGDKVAVAQMMKAKSVP